MNANSQILLDVQNVSQQYPLPKASLLAKARHIQALSDVSFKLAAGKSMGIVGESGSGKSTLLDFITCSIQSNIVAEGQVSLPGSMAYVPQDDRLHGFYTTKKYMEHYGRLAGMKNRKVDIMDSKVSEQARPSVPRLVDGCALVAGTRRIRPSLRLAGTICALPLYLLLGLCTRSPPVSDRGPKKNRLVHRARRAPDIFRL